MIMDWCETTYLDKIKSPRTTHEGGADIKIWSLFG